MKYSNIFRNAKLKIKFAVLANKRPSRGRNEASNDPNLYNSRRQNSIDKIESSMTLENLARNAELSERQMENLECQPGLSGSAGQSDGQDSKNSKLSTPASLNEWNCKLVSTRTMPKPVSKHNIPISITVVTSQISSPFEMVEQNDGTSYLVAQYNSGVY